MNRQPLTRATSLKTKIMGVRKKTASSPRQTPYPSQIEAGTLDEPTEAPPRLQVTVRQNGFIVEASVSGASEVVWKNRLLDPGDWCNASTFALAPNNPSVHSSNRLVIPESATSQNFYRNKWLCFQAIAVDTTDREAYAQSRIYLGNPIISIRQHVFDGFAYLQAYSNEEVAYRVGWFDSGALGGGVSRNVGDLCEKLFLDVYYIFSLEQIRKTAGLVTLTPGNNYCFEATDNDGMKTYVHAYPNAGQIISYHWNDHLQVFLPGTSGRVDWALSGPSESGICNASAFSLENSFPKQYFPAHPGQQHLSVLFDSDGYDKYFCFRAVDQLGNTDYSKIKPESPPIITIRQEGNRLDIRLNKDAAGIWLIGPSEVEELDCRESFERERNLLRPQEEANHATVEFDAQADINKSYCIVVQDNRGRWIFKKYNIAPS